MGAVDIALGKGMGKIRGIVILQRIEFFCVEQWERALEKPVSIGVLDEYFNELRAVP